MERVTAAERATYLMSSGRRPWKSHAAKQLKRRRRSLPSVVLQGTFPILMLITVPDLVTAPVLMVEKWDKKDKPEKGELIQSEKNRGLRPKARVQPNGGNTTGTHLRLAPPKWRLVLARGNSMLSVILGPPRFVTRATRSRDEYMGMPPHHSPAIAHGAQMRPERIRGSSTWGVGSPKSINTYHSQGFSSPTAMESSRATICAGNNSKESEYWSL